MDEAALAAAALTEAPPPPTPPTSAAQDSIVPGDAIDALTTMGVDVAAETAALEEAAASVLTGGVSLGLDSAALASALIFAPPTSAPVAPLPAGSMGLLGGPVPGSGAAAGNGTGLGAGAGAGDAAQMPRDRRLSFSDECFLPKDMVDGSHPKVQRVLMDSHVKLYSDEDVELPSRLRSASFSRAFPSPSLGPSAAPSGTPTGLTPLLTGGMGPPGYTNTNPFVLGDGAMFGDPTGVGALAAAPTGGALEDELEDDDEEYAEPGSRRRGRKSGAVNTRGATKKRRTGRGGAVGVGGRGGLGAGAGAGAAAAKPRKPAGNRRGDGRKDASKAEQFLAYIRDTSNPTGEGFRQFVHKVNIGLSENNELGRAMKRFDTRPKYVLRKLAFSILPETSAKREAFARDVLKLAGKVSTQQREAIKTDLITILLAICDKAPSMAMIPQTFNAKQYNHKMGV